VTVAAPPASAVALAARLQALGEPDADTVRRRIFDTLGAIAAGRTTVASGVLERVVPAVGPLDEIRAVCAAARASEIDDIDRLSPTTPGAVAVPVALVLAAARGASGEVVLGAVAAGYEAMVAVGDAIDGAHRLRAGVWPSYVAAPIAAAAAAARLLGLDADATAHALAIAATRTAGVAGRIADDATSRWLTFGAAAADGVLAALAAEAGMAGDLGVLDRALAAAAAGPVDPAALAGAGADGPAIERVEVKPFCTARQTQAAVEAARLAHAVLGGAPVARADVHVPAAYRAMVDQPAPHGRLQSISSAQFQIAAALTGGAALYDVARRDVEPGPAARALMERIVVVADDALTPLYPRLWPARVRLVATDGREAVREVRDAPALAAWRDLSAKHMRVGAWGRGLNRALDACRTLGTGDDAGDTARTLLHTTEETCP